MNNATMSTRIKRTDTGAVFALHYPEYPANCDSLTVVNEANGQSMTLTAKAFEASSVDALAALVEFTGGSNEGKDFGAFDVVGIDDYRLVLGTEDVQFATFMHDEDCWWETAYWHIDELTEDAELVLGAICGALNSVDEVDEDDAVELHIA